MTTNTDLDVKIRELLTQLDRATPLPPSFDELGHTERPTPSRVVPMLAAATIAVLGTGGIVALSARDQTPAALPSAAQPSAGVHVETPTASLDATSLAVVTADHVWEPTADDRHRNLHSRPRGAIPIRVHLRRPWHRDHRRL